MSNLKGLEGKRDYHKTYFVGFLLNPIAQSQYSSYRKYQE